MCFNCLTVRGIYSGEPNTYFGNYVATPFSFFVGLKYSPKHVRKDYMHTQIRHKLHENPQTIVQDNECKTAKGKQ